MFTAGLLVPPGKKFGEHSASLVEDLPQSGDDPCLSLLRAFEVNGAVGEIDRTSTTALPGDSLEELDRPSLLCHFLAKSGHLLLLLLKSINI